MCLTGQFLGVPPGCNTCVKKIHIKNFPLETKKVIKFKLMLSVGRQHGCILKNNQKAQSTLFHHKKDGLGRVLRYLSTL